MVSLPAKRPLIMGIVNATPDSFSGDGLMAQDAAVAAAARMLEEGADILDIGGESSRPGAAPVSADEEIRRTIPIIAAIRKGAAASVPIAIDTVKAEVAKAALEAGANLINDISALGDPAMGALAAQQRCPIVLMHNCADAKAVAHDEKLGARYEATGSGDIVIDVVRELGERIDVAQKTGIARSNIIIDPGIGFGKTVAQNLALIRNIGALKKLGCPVLIGASRKSFIGQILDASVEDRLEGTAAVASIAAFLGADILRVHDVKFIARATKMAAALKG